MAESIRRVEYRSGPQPYWIRTAMEPNDVAGEQASHVAEPDIRSAEHGAISEITIAQFVEWKFLPEHVATKRTPGRRHYQAILKHVLNPDLVDRMFGVNAERSRSKLKVNPDWPYLDQVRLAEVQPEDVQRLITVALKTGYSTQTAKHIRNVVSAIISHAIKERYFWGNNPAMQVAPPGMQRKTAYALSFDQTVKVLQSMRYPEWEMALIAILTGMNIAEICGLQWKYVNMTDHIVKREEELIPPNSIAIRRQWYRGELSSVPEGRRKHALMPNLLRSAFLQLSAGRSVGWNDFVLVSRSGKPINQINVAARRLKTIGEQLGIPWLSWQVFRRTRASLVHEFGAQLQNELAMAITMKSRLPPISIEKGRQR
jgi:integrase